MHRSRRASRAAQRLAMLVILAIGGAAAKAGDEQPTIEKCPRELGTLAVGEPEQSIISSLARYSLGSPSAMLRMIVQESGCFAVVERGAGFQNLERERALAAGGQLQSGSNLGSGQLQAADFVMTPAIQFSDDTGGMGGTMSGLLGRLPGALGALGGIAGGVKFKEAETTLLVSDVRSGIQVASAEGKASKMNFSLGGWGWGALGWAAAGGYSKTPEGKLIAASLLENYNKIVLSIRDRPQLIRANSQASQNNAAMSPPAGGEQPVPGSLPPPPPPPPPPQALPPPPPPSATASGHVGAALPTGLIGAFSGQYGGGDKGIFSVMVAWDGQVTGIGQSMTGPTFTVSGTLKPSGDLSMNSSGTAGSAIFVGVIDARSGVVSGTWRMMGGPGQGTFTGQRH